MTSWIEANLGFSPDLTRRFAATIVLIIVILVFRWFTARWLSRTVSDGDLLFRSRKALTYISTAVLVLLLTWIWLPFVEDLGTFIGLLSAGLVIALADVFMDLAGWVFIMFRRPFKVGDRIEIDGTAGDVIDIRAFRFTLLEIKNWVDADQATGRVVHVPNGKLFKNSAANYTEGFFHIWHEIPVLITFESDWNRAEEVLRETVAPLAISEEELRHHQEIATAEHDYFIRFRELRPTVYVSTRASGVLLTVRLLVEARRRRSVDDQFWRTTLEAFAAEPSVSLAYPTTRAYLDDPLVVRTEEV